MIGVGGFLGIGEKNVAVPFSAIQAATDSDGNVKLVVQFSKDDLNKAPEFLTLADIKAKQAAPATEAPAPAPVAVAALCRECEPAGISGGLFVGCVGNLS